jgi:hypothetical protein
MSDITLLENLVPESYSTLIEEQLLRNAPWFFNPSAADVGTNFDPADRNIYDAPQYVHGICESGEPISEYYQLVMPLMWFLEKETKLPINSIARIKANSLLNVNQTGKYNPPHIDVAHPGSMSMIYYVNDSDGDTIIFDKYVNEGHMNLKEVDRITPKKGSALLLPSHLFHASSNPVKTERRVVINFVFGVNHA